LLERALIACSSLIALLLLSCVVLRYRRTADTRRAGCASLPHAPLPRPCGPSAGDAEKRCLHALSSFQRTKDLRGFFNRPSPAGRHPITWILPRPFLGEPSKLTTTYLPSSTLFSLPAKNSLGDLLGRRNVLDREPCVNRVFSM